uniref:Uncharacterized protein n=1 Tax=Arundo donax TaxID=35708 RepID=A0A0A9CVC1_ARUDO
MLNDNNTTRINKFHKALCHPSSMLECQVNLLALVLCKVDISEYAMYRGKYKFTEDSMAADPSHKTCL